jgi:hypothetical protein
MSRILRRTPTIAAAAAYGVAGIGAKDDIIRLTMHAASKVADSGGSRLGSAKVLISASKGEPR